MILESLKSSKFEAFKSNELQNAMKVLGGAPTGVGTINTDDGRNDHMDGSSDDTAQGDVVYSVSAGSAAQINQMIQNGIITFQTTVDWTPLSPCS